MRKIILTFITIFAMVTMIACTPKNDEQLTLLNNFADGYTFDTSLKNDQLDIPEMVDIAGLGTVFLSFTSSDPLVIDEDGKVFRKEVAQDVTIEVNFEYQNLVTKRTYALTVEKIALYTITFISESDTVIESQTIHQGALVNKPNNPVKTGYTFLGWFLDDLAFDFNTPVTKDMTLTARWQKDEVEAYYTLSFETNSLTIIESQTVRKNENFTKPDDPIKEGYIFEGWYLEPTLDTPFDFNMPATMDLTIYAKYIYEDVPLAPAESGAYFEAIYAIWDDKDAFNANVYYKASSNTEWLRVDQALIRQISESNARVDVVGIQAGYYDIKIETSTHQTLVVQELYTARNDRSGYAHFNYNEGIGGYNDDGTLKENAIVVYVTEANKNDIEIPGIGQKGLGWILNNNQYFSSQSNTNSTANQLSSLAFFNQPIVFRIIGKVTAPEGLTVYNSTNQGGSVGDNGQMARIRNANHMTIEGIGEDAEIYGWGIHFMAMSEGRGIGFEVKNLTFRHYPEDALGLEGVQSNNVLTIPVQRGWIHHVTFYEGYHPNPAESDKANGDGSLDIKRGQYFTVAYNQFLGAHKTNLVGSSNSSLQYHITYHHNHWQNNASRIPLARQANIHMYNNVFETTDDNVNEASYAQNTRANAYIFSEANYFIGTKNPSRVDGGAIKSWQDIKYSTYGQDDAIKADSRTQQVVSGNKFENFDTNPAIFYYDAVNQKSDVEHITDAMTARSEVLAYAGHYRKYETPKLEKVTQIEPTTLTESVSLDVTKIQKSTPLLVFEVLTMAEVQLIAGSASIPPVLVTIYGQTLLTGSGTVQIEPGIYLIESAQAHGASKGTSQAKESSAGYIITLDSEAQKQARIDLVNEYISDLEDNMPYNISNQNKVSLALDAYNALLADEKLLVDGLLLETRVEAFYQNGKSYIEELITNIGIVSPDSLDTILLARNAYDLALEDIQVLIENYQVLMDAEVTFESFKIDAMIHQIDTLMEVSTIPIDDLEMIEEHILTYETLKALFDNLLEEEKELITNSNKLLNGLTTLYEMRIPYDVISYIEALNLDEINRTQSMIIINHYQNYIALDDASKALISDAITNKLITAYDIAQNIQANSYLYIIDKDMNTDNYFDYVGDNPVNMGTTTPVYGYDIQYASKLNSSAYFSFTTTTENATLIVVVRTRKDQSGGRLDIDGIIYDLDPLYEADGLAYIEVTLEAAKTYTIKRDNRELVIYYLEVLE